MEIQLFLSITLTVLFLQVLKHGFGISAMEMILPILSLHDTLSHRYILPGVYEVKFAISATVSGFFMSDTMHQTIEIFERPIARIDSQSLGVCFGNPIYFSDASIYVPGDPGSEWNWNFSDGNFSSLKNPVTSLCRYRCFPGDFANNDHAWLYRN
jgi:hypothetical protein